ncbi:MAG: cytidine deaminase [Myxococcaceae bacterium]|nr:cytidine deaminase [Myxococcaceae bacterium]MCI0671414.1 cytidine deaminase [Myxococcaceae bacterium]
MDNIPWEELFATATQARERAHAPYSQFRVGAAVLYEDGSIVPGCNVENASYGLTLCAERNAVARGVMDGRRGLAAVAIVADSAVPCTPCGMCRQVLAEFATPAVPVRSRTLEGTEAQYTLGELLPHAFGPSFL